VNPSYDKSAVLAVLPAVSGGRLQDGSLRTWLAQAELVRVPSDVELLSQLTGVLDLPYPQEGLAALRMWGQTGERPMAWIAAADPVYLEPRLDHLCLHDLSGDLVAPQEFRALIEHLQATLAGDRQFGFIRLGQHGYLSAASPMPTAQVPAYVVNQRVPSDYLPAGKEAAAYRNLLSEVEMSLHDQEFNQRRISGGKPPVNSLWFWGGGQAPAPTTKSLPPLFCDDPLLLGYWDSTNSSASLWPGTIADCLKVSQDAGFVAVTPADEDSPDFLEHCLRQLRAALRQKQVDRLTLLFRDGLRADIVRSQRLRFWRRNSRLLD
jgi:hypothetical protein